ncbi:hypothetical protein [Streptomyces spinosus]|uniref:hypothetical protein n=1 Tax=Streptomyces spinosus TaxID=2872623 RepID=UPI001CEDC271|nr:hypothetical protein [Streptomyces spinosus]
MRYPTVAAGPSDRLWEAVAADVAEGAPPLSVLAPVQEGAGAERAAGRTTVAQEHAATAIDERAVAPHPRPVPTRHAPRPGRVTVGRVGAGWHAVPARLAADVLRPRARRVGHPRARTPTPHPVAHPHRTDAVPLPGSPPTGLTAPLFADGPGSSTASPPRTADAPEARHPPAAPRIPPRRAPAARGGAVVPDRTPRPVPGPRIEA